MSVGLSGGLPFLGISGPQTPAIKSSIMNKYKVVGPYDGSESHLAKIGSVKIFTSGKTLCGLSALTMRAGEEYFMPHQVSCKVCIERIKQ